MRHLRWLAIVIGLAVFAPIPAHSIFIFQNIQDPSEESRVAGGELLRAIADVYGTIAMVERNEISDAGSTFEELSERLLRVADETESIVGRTATGEDIPHHFLDEYVGERVARQIREVFSANSYANWILGTDEWSLAMPSNDVAVYEQSGRVIRRLADYVREASELRSQDATVAHVENFRSLNAAVSQAVDVLALHSILLSLEDFR